MQDVPIRVVLAEDVRSLAFYRDRLGLRVAGESENYGGHALRVSTADDSR